MSTQQLQQVHDHRRLITIRIWTMNFLNATFCSNGDTVGESPPIRPLPLPLVARPRNGISVSSHAVGPSPMHRSVQ